jgi:hypothetical protein
VSRQAKTGSLGALLPVAAVELDGLIVTTTGQWVRLLEASRVPNTVTADDARLRRIEKAFADACRAIPDHGSLSVYAETDPVPVGEALARDKQRVEQAARADEAAGLFELASARRRFFTGLKQTVVAAAGAEQPAVATRWWIAVPYQPQITTARARARSLAARARGRTTWREHRTAAVESGTLASTVQAALAGAGIETSPLDGVEALAVLWERLHPKAERLPDFGALEDACAPYAGSATIEEAARARHRVVTAVCEGSRIDAGESPGYLRHGDGTIEEIIHLGTPPQHTNLWWLQMLLACPRPMTLAVHIAVGDRRQEKARQRRRWKRHRAAVLYKERRNQTVGAEEDEAVEEAAALDQELASTPGATVYRVGIYASIRDPDGEPESFERTVERVCREFQTHTEARVNRGRWLAAAGFTATLPLGVDPLRARCAYAQRNIPHTLPLTWSGCGSPDGPVAGLAHPGGTIERLDAFDPLYPRRVTSVIGPSGGGKTVLMNMLATRLVSQGMRGFLVDRSSTPDEQRATAGSGHYDTLLSLVPGSRRVQLGHKGGAVICPWDVHDPASVPAEHHDFLLAFHEALIGHPTAADRRIRHLTADEESLLLTAIQDTYRRCVENRELEPRESVLLEQLCDRAAHGGLQGAVADALSSLIVRLEPYCDRGPFAHLADRPTTIAGETPLTLFDVTALSERLTAPMMLVLVNHVEHSITRARRARVAGQLDDEGAWAGRYFLTIEEGWALTASPASGRWLNEYARRSRHYALWLFFISQHFKDLDTEQGRAMLSNSVLTLCLQNDRKDLEHARGTLGLTDTDIEEITSLAIQPGIYSTVYAVSRRGRGAIRIELGDIEYWICSADPEHDQPRRAAALTQTGGDAWAALTLLCTPEWHETYERRAAT